LYGKILLYLRTILIFSKYTTILLYLIFQFINAQSFSISGNINARYGNGIQFNNLGEETDFKYNEILTDLNFEWNKYSGWIQYEYSDPPEYGRSLNTIRRFRFRHSANNLNISIGDNYRSWDRGLVLSQFEDQQIDFDNSIRGIGININNDNLELDIIAGTRKQYQSTPFNTDLRKHDESVKNKLIAGRVGFKTGILQNGFSTLIVNTEFPLITRGGISDDKSNVTNIFSGYSFELNQSNWDVAFDVVLKRAQIDPKLYFIETDYSDFSTDSIARDNHSGYGIYTVINKYFNNWSLTFDYKKYHFAVMNPDRRLSYPYPEGSIIYQNPPLTFFEHSSTLLNRNIHQLNKNDEIGYQLTLMGVLNHNFELLLNFSRGSRNAIWKRELGDFAWQKQAWERGKSAIILPLTEPASNPYNEIYGEISSYLLDDQLLTKVGFSNSSQSLLLFENIVSDSFDSLSYEFIDAITIPIDLSYAFQSGYSIELKYQWQRITKGIRSEITKSGEAYSNETSLFYEMINGLSVPRENQNVSIFQFGVQKSPSWGISFTVEKDKYHEFGINSENLEINPLEKIWENLGIEPDLTWLSIELLLNIAKKYRFNIFYGSEKGGLQCRNGVCKIIQPFSDGVRVGFTTYF